MVENAAEQPRSPLSPPLGGVGRGGGVDREDGEGGQVLQETGQGRGQAPGPLRGQAGRRKWEDLRRVQAPRKHLQLPARRWSGKQASKRANTFDFVYIRDSMKIIQDFREKF